MDIDQHKPALFYFLAVGARIKVNTYRFADYKEQVVGLLWSVTTVSVGSQRIVGTMAAVDLVAPYRVR